MRSNFFGNNFDKPIFQFYTNSYLILRGSRIICFIQDKSNVIKEKFNVNVAEFLDLEIKVEDNKLNFGSKHRDYFIFTRYENEANIKELIKKELNI